MLGRDVTYRDSTEEQLGPGHWEGCGRVRRYLGMRAPAYIEKVTFDLPLTRTIRVFQMETHQRHREH